MILFICVILIKVHSRLGFHSVFVDVSPRPVPRCASFFSMIRGGWFTLNRLTLGFLQQVLGLPEHPQVCLDKVTDVWLSVSLLLLCSVLGKYWVRMTGDAGGRGRELWFPRG